MLRDLGLSGLGRRLATEREQWLLWLPVGLLAGIAGYFALPVEPPPWSGAVGMVVLLVAAIALRRAAGAAASCGLVAAIVAAGFALAQFETARVAAPILDGEVGPRPVTGRLIEVEPRENDIRIALGDIEIPRMDPERTPARVRITVRTKGGIPPIPGQRVTILAILDTPPGPAWPGGFDFGRDAFFDRIGGVGFAVGPLRAADDGETPPAGLWRRLNDRLETVRLAATSRITAALPGDTGAVAAALLTGERGSVSRHTLDDIRDAGLAHLLAISGLHLGMVAAIAFFVVRLLLAAIEPVALHRPIKLWAACVALLVAFGYLLISGMTVPTQRAFLMTGIVLVAVIFGRQAISLRLVAVAAVVILVISPHVALGASFQLSFAAVLGLVAVWEVLRNRVPGWRSAAGLPGRIGLFLAGILVTTMIANAATAPFVLAHFGRMATWGPLANLLAVPVFSVWVMPWGLLALLLMPLGLEQFALVPMGWGIDLILAIAHRCASLPWAHLAVPAPTPWTLVLAGAGFLWLCLWRTSWRLAGIAGLAAAAALFATARPPDLLVTGDADLVALRLSDHTLAVSSLRRGAFVRQAWSQMSGNAGEVAWPAPGSASDDGLLRCDDLGCLYRPPDAPTRTVAIVRDPGALQEDCLAADLVVALVPVFIACPAPLGVVDRFDLWRQGNYAISVTETDITVSTVAAERGVRPWSPGRPTAEAQ